MILAWGDPVDHWALAVVAGHELWDKLLVHWRRTRHVPRVHVRRRALIKRRRTAIARVHWGRAIKGKRTGITGRRAGVAQRRRKVRVARRHMTVVHRWLHASSGRRGNVRGLVAWRSRSIAAPHEGRCGLLDWRWRRRGASSRLDGRR